MSTAAAVWHGPGGGVRVEQLPLPDPRAGEVLVRVVLATVCGSDRHTAAGRRDAAWPGVLGHEAVGVVERVGDGDPVGVGGGPVRPGDRVVWGVTLGCGTCDRCRRGRTAKCRALRKFGHEPLQAGWPLSGSYAGHVLLPAGAAIAHVPAALPDAVAAPAACATATVMAVLERAGPLAGLRVLVLGCGMLGLTAVAAAADAGASTIVATDRDPARLAQAAAFGATATVAAADALPLVDVALDLTGATAAMAAALGVLDVDGILVLAGAVLPGPPLAVDAEAVVRGWQTIAGVHNYEPRHLAAAVAFLERTCGTRPWAALVAPPVGLARVGELLTGPPAAQPRTAVRP